MNIIIPTENRAEMYSLLIKFPRLSLREYARWLHIPIGRSKRETVFSIINSGHAEIEVTLKKCGEL